MVIMAIDQSLTKSLITASVSTLLIVIIVAWVQGGSWKDVLGITAAYAAVLVVFVGTSVQGGGTMSTTQKSSSDPYHG